MEKSRNAVQKIQKMKDLGIYNRFLKNSENRIRELYRMYSFSEEYPFTAEIETTFETFVEYDRNIPAARRKRAIVKFLKVY